MAFLKAQILAEERDHAVLKTIRDGAGMGAVINLEVIDQAIIVENLVQFSHVKP
jgi:hypothetical protein